MNKKKKQTRGNKSSTLQNRSSIKNLESYKIEANIYCTISKLEKKRSFSSLKEFVEWLAKQDRTFSINFFDDCLHIGFTPNSDDDGNEESTESVEKALLEGVNL